MRVRMTSTDTPASFTMYGTIVRRRRNRSSRDSATLYPRFQFRFRFRGDPVTDLLQPGQDLAAKRLRFDQLDALAEGQQPRNEPGVVRDRDPSRGVNVAPPRQAEP